MYVAAVFAIVFLLLVPLFQMATWLKKEGLGLRLYQWWCSISFFLIGIKIDTQNMHLLRKGTTYIFCPNHFSFLDPLAMLVVPFLFRFVGMHSLSSIPVFGYYYRRYHIMVNRENLKSNYDAYKQSIEALKNGHSLTVFPEGGINTTNAPIMTSFKKGPFRMAIETGVSIVPVTISDNWKILPDDNKRTIQWKRNSHIIIHEPIHPSGYDETSLKEFRDDVREIIQKELSRRNGINAIQREKESGRVNDGPIAVHS